MERITFYPCCQRDIASPAAMLSGLTDRIVYCDIADTLRDARDPRTHWPKRTFWRYDAWQAIDDLPRIDTLFYRRDSGHPVDGSRFFVFGKWVFPKILQKMTAPVSLIITDGSNSRGGTIRKMNKKAGLTIAGRHIVKRSEQRFERYGLTEYEVHNLDYHAEHDQSDADFLWRDRAVLTTRPKIEDYRFDPDSLPPVVHHLAVQGLRTIASKSPMPDWMTNWPNGLFIRMFAEMFHRDESIDDLWRAYHTRRRARPEERFQVMDLLYRVLVREMFDGNSMGVEECTGEIVRLFAEIREKGPFDQVWVLDHGQKELDWLVENAFNMRFWFEMVDDALREMIAGSGVPRKTRDLWHGTGYA